MLGSGFDVGSLKVPRVAIASLRYSGRYCVTYMEKYIMYITLLGTHLLRWLANNRSLKESIIAEKKAEFKISNYY